MRSGLNAVNRASETWLLLDPRFMHRERMTRSVRLHLPRSLYFGNLVIPTSIELKE